MDWWNRRGYLRAETGGPGSGYPRTFSEEEKQIAKLMGKLVRTGFTAKSASKLARRMLTKNARALNLGEGVHIYLDIPEWNVLVVTEDSNLSTIRKVG